MNSKQTILICGASGFIGRNLAKFYAQQERYNVVGTYYTSDIPSDIDIAWKQVDLTNAEAVSKVVEGADIIIQAAATTSGAKDIVNRPYYHVTDNALMNTNLLRAAYDHSVKHFIFFSCTVMYPSSESPLKEEDFDANQDPYPNYFGVAWTKIYIEKMCEFYARLGRTKHTVIRHSNIYGPHDKFDLERSHVFGATITKVLQAKDGKIVVWGTGEEERDLLYVDDLVDFVDKALERQKPDYALYNAGYGSSISVANLVRKIIALSGRTLDIVHDESQPSIKTKLCLDCSKAKQELNWEPHHSLEQGIEKTLEWHRNNI